MIEGYGNHGLSVGDPEGWFDTDPVLVVGHEDAIPSLAVGTLVEVTGTVRRYNGDLAGDFRSFLPEADDFDVAIVATDVKVVERPGTAEPDERLEWSSESKDRW